jgi:hypothetical protein
VTGNSGDGGRFRAYGLAWGCVRPTGTTANIGGEPIPTSRRAGSSAKETLKATQCELAAVGRSTHNALDWDQVVGGAYMEGMGEGGETLMVEQVIPPAQ